MSVLANTIAVTISVSVGGGMVSVTTVAMAVAGVVVVVRSGVAFGGNILTDNAATDSETCVGSIDSRGTSLILQLFSFDSSAQDRVLAREGN